MAISRPRKLSQSSHGPLAARRRAVEYSAGESPQPAAPDSFDLGRSICTTRARRNRREQKQPRTELARQGIAVAAAPACLGITSGRPRRRSRADSASVACHPSSRDVCHGWMARYSSFGARGRNVGPHALIGLSGLFPQPQRGETSCANVANNRLAYQDNPLFPAIIFHRNPVTALPVLFEQKKKTHRAVPTATLFRFAARSVARFHR